MGNQNCAENCQGFSENERVLDHIASRLAKNRTEEEPEEFEKVKSSKQGNWDKNMNSNNNQSQNFDNLENFNKNFLGGYRRIIGLCTRHLLNPYAYKLKKLFNFHEFEDEINSSMEQFNTNEDLANKKLKTNFFNSKMLECIHNYRDYINNYLKTSFNDYLDSNSINANFYENLFEFEISSDNKINILGNIEKNYYVKGTNEIFIEFYLNMPDEEQSVFGVKILRRGRIFAGRFDKVGNLTGDGIYISKKGDLYIGEFEKNDISRATIYCYKGQTYEGSVKNLRKHGQMQTEVSQFYEFLGDFENGKKTQGIFYPKYDQEIDINLNNNFPNDNYNNLDSNSKVKIKSIEINRDNLEILRQAILENKRKNQKYDNYEDFKFCLDFEQESYIAKITFECEGKLIVYTGCVNENKLNDVNAILQFDLIEKFPLFHGSIRNNNKDGKCRYYNNEKDFFSGSFIDSKFYSDVELIENEKRRLQKEQMMNSNQDNRTSKNKSSKNLVKAYDSQGFKSAYKSNKSLGNSETQNKNDVYETKQANNYEKSVHGKSYKSKDKV